MTLTREQVLKMISKRVVEAVLLSHHLSEYDEPHGNYVEEKMADWPSLDKGRTEPFIDIGAILIEYFGIPINKNRYHFTPEDVN